MTVLLTGAPPRRPRDADATKGRILEAARALFAAKGFDGTRMKEIAERTGVTAALLHHYYDTKQELYHTVVERGVAAMRTRGFALLDRESPRDGLAALVGLLTDFYADNREIVAILQHERANPSSGIDEVAKSALRPIFRAVVAYIERGQREGTFRRDLDPEHVVVSGIGMISGFFSDAPMLRAIWRDDVDAPAVLEARKRQVVALIFGGLLAPTSP
jgi:AcrR family transcriptional regulator